jgi:hypothetical protein
MSTTTAKLPANSPKTSRGTSALPRWEFITVAAVIAVFVVACFVTRNRHFPWGDEVMLISPAVNAFFGLGFHSTIYRPGFERFSYLHSYWENVPVYATVSLLWYKLFGFSNGTARVLNYVLMALASFEIWLAVLRLRVVKNPIHRCCLIVTLISGSATEAAYTTLRYDTWAIFVCATAFLIYSVRHDTLRTTGLLIVGMLMPLSGIHLPPYVTMLSFALLCFGGLGILKRLVPLYFGIVAGTIALLTCFWLQGAIPGFIFSLKTEGGQTLIEKLHNLGYYFSYDLSTILLLLSLAVLVVFSASAHKHKVIWFGLCVGTCLPLALFLMRRFVFSYAWEVYIPVCICLFAALSVESSNPASTRKYFVGISIVLACCIGFPKAMLGILMEWHDRDYARVEKLVQGTISPNDVVISDWTGYVAAIEKDRHLYVVGAENVMSDTERQKVSVLIIPPEQLAQLQSTIGGRWVLAAKPIAVDEKGSSPRLPGFVVSKFGYKVSVFRRVGL